MNASGSYIIHACTNNTILIPWLIEIADVIDNDVCRESLRAGVREINAVDSGKSTNGVGEINFTEIGSRNPELRARRHLVDDLAKPAGFIGAGAGSFIMKHKHRRGVVRVAGSAWEIEIRHILRRVSRHCCRPGIVTIGQTSNRYSVTVERH